VLSRRHEQNYSENVDDLPGAPPADAEWPMRPVTLALGVQTLLHPEASEDASFHPEACDAASVHFEARPGRPLPSPAVFLSLAKEVDLGHVYDEGELAEDMDVGIVSSERTPISGLGNVCRVTHIMMPTENLDGEDSFYNSVQSSLDDMIGSCLQSMLCDCESSQERRDPSCTSEVHVPQDISAKLREAPFVSRSCRNAADERGAAAFGVSQIGYNGHTEVLNERWHEGINPEGLLSRTEVDVDSAEHGKSGTLNGIARARSRGGG
jgi:hypothetical protein